MLCLSRPPRNQRGERGNGLLLENFHSEGDVSVTTDRDRPGRGCIRRWTRSAVRTRREGGHGQQEVELTRGGRPGYQLVPGRLPRPPWKEVYFMSLELLGDGVSTASPTGAHRTMLALLHDTVVEVARRRQDELPGLVETLQDDVVLTMGGAMTSCAVTRYRYRAAAGSRPRGPRHRQLPPPAVDQRARHVESPVCGDAYAGFGRGPRLCPGFTRTEGFSVGTRGCSPAEG